MQKAENPLSIHGRNNLNSEILINHQIYLTEYITDICRLCRRNATQSLVLSWQTDQTTHQEGARRSMCDICTTPQSGLLLNTEKSLSHLWKGTKF